MINSCIASTAVIVGRLADVVQRPYLVGSLEFLTPLLWALG